VIKLPLQLVPEPRKEKAFTAQSVGAINFLVGPNGSGKSRFAIALKLKLAGARILNTDHLEGLEGAGAFRTLFGDHSLVALQRIVSQSSNKSVRVTCSSRTGNVKGAILQRICS
jgi:hypothetical protein